MELIKVRRSSLHGLLTLVIGSADIKIKKKKKKLKKNGNLSINLIAYDIPQGLSK